MGGGAVFLHLAPETAALSDVNADLINFYRCIRSDWKKLHAGLERLQVQHSEPFYYRTRSSAPRTSLNKALRFLYLNRTCFNGIYRVNKQGEFNVPIGTKQNVVLVTDDFFNVAKRLKSARLRCEDFEPAIERAERGDLIFADPPYTVNHNLNGFLKYNESIFSWDDQIRLHQALRRAIRRGVKVIVTNANHESVRTLYSDFKTLRILARSSVMAADVSSRAKTTEILIRSW